MRIVHFSDTHLPRAGELLYERIDPWANLSRVLAAIERLAPDAVVLTGDVADQGAPVHARAAAILAAAQERLRCPVVAIPGNHDPAGSIDRRFNTQRISTGPLPGTTVHEVQGLRIIGLDSGGFQLPQGRIDAAQQRWLKNLLSVPAPTGTILAVHHPPVPSSSDEMAGRGLAEPEVLASLVAGSDVRAILCGHYHQSAASSLMNIPVFMAGATSYNMDPLQPGRVLEGGAQFSLLSLTQSAVTSVAVFDEATEISQAAAKSYLRC